MNNKNILLAAMLAASAPTWADELLETQPSHHMATPATPMTLPVGEHMMHFDNMQFNMPLMHMRAKLVKNAPYSAEVIFERVQNLPDGNQIVNKSSTMHYRDSAGRTRQETRDAKGELKRVTIIDSAENITYVLYPKDKKAAKIAMKGEREASKQAREKAHERIEQLKKEGKVTVTEHGDGNHIVVKRVERSDGDAASPRVVENIQVRVAQAVSNGLNVEMARVAPLVANAFNDVKWASKPNTKELGARDFDGVKAEGKMRSYEIPAGEVGNKNPITVSSESWFSPELQITVYSKQSDPRTGDRIYRLGNLKREEPAAALFTVPSDYTVKEMASNTRMQVEKHIDKK